MPTTTSIDSVTTEDAAPTTAPHKISAISGKDTATVKLTPTHDGNLVPCAELIPSEGALVPSERLTPDEALAPYDGIYPGRVQPMIGVRVEEGGSAVGTGTLMDYVGAPCSDTLLACSDSRPCTDWSSTSGAQLTRILSYAETGGPADGNQTINVYVNTEAQGWS